MPAPPLSEWAATLQTARTGARDALGRLLEPHRAELTRIARRKLPPCLRSKASAADLVQDALLEAQRCFADFRGQSPAELQGWLRAIVRCKVANFARGFCDCAKRCQGREVPLGSLAALALADHSPSPSQTAIRHEEMGQLEQTLARLPGRYREVIRLRHWERRPFEEIGERLSCSAPAARMVLRRAVAALREAMQTPPAAARPATPAAGAGRTAPHCHSAPKTAGKPSPPDLRAAPAERGTHPERGQSPR
jgi:RNA polymerase sigma-70 factor (ECF subfamily)